MVMAFASTGSVAGAVEVRLAIALGAADDARADAGTDLVTPEHEGRTGGAVEGAAVGVPLRRGLRGLRGPRGGGERELLADLRGALDGGKDGGLERTGRHGRGRQERLAGGVAAQLGLHLRRERLALDLGRGHVARCRGSRDGGPVGQPLVGHGRRCRRPRPRRHVELRADHGRAGDGGCRGLLDHGVVEVDEAAGPARADGDAAPVEVPAPVVLRHEDLGGGDDLLDVGDVTGRAGRGDAGAVPRDGSDPWCLVDQRGHRDAPARRVPVSRPRPGGGHPVLDEAVRHVVGAVVPGVHPPVHGRGGPAVARVAVAGALAPGVAGAQVGRRRREGSDTTRSDRGDERERSGHDSHQAAHAQDSHPEALAGAVRRL